AAKAAAASASAAKAAAGTSTSTIEASHPGLVQRFGSDHQSDHVDRKRERLLLRRADLLGADEELHLRLDAGLAGARSRERHLEPRVGVLGAVALLTDRVLVDELVLLGRRAGALELDLERRLVGDVRARLRADLDDDLALLAGLHLLRGAAGVDVVEPRGVRSLRQSCQQHHRDHVIPCRPRPSGVLYRTALRRAAPPLVPD